MGLAGVLVTAFGALAALAYAKRSRWASVVAAGLSLQVLGQLAAQFMIPVLVLMHSSRAADLPGSSLALSVFGLIARIVVVAGVIGMLADVSQASRKADARSSSSSPH